MNRRYLILEGILLQLVLMVSLCNCVTKRNVMPYKQSQDKQKVNVGLNVNKNANFSFTVSTEDPVVLRTFVMQGFDLTFIGEYEYTVKVPSAKDVEKLISHHPGEVKATLQDNQEKRPDIRPVLEALNKTDVFIFLKGKKAGKVKYFNASIDPINGLLTYNITLPNIYTMDLPLTVNLFSQREMEIDEFHEVNQLNRNTSDRPQPFGVGQPPRFNDDQKQLSINYYFGKPAKKQPR